MTDEELIAALGAAREEGIYSHDPAWKPIDDALRDRGFHPDP